jgi:GMP synthase (glutamine-hydrolysing)
LCSDSGKIKESLEPLKRQVSEIARSLELSGTVLPVKSVGVQGDLRTYAFPAVVSFANDSRRDWETLKRCASLLVNNLQSLNRVVFSMVPLIGIQLEKSFITRERLDQLRKVDNIVQDMTSHLRDIWQLPVISLPVVDSSGKAVFVMRPVSSENAMTAEAYPLSFELIDRIQKKVWEVDNAGLLLLDLTSKPPGTIEWE